MSTEVVRTDESNGSGKLDSFSSRLFEVAAAFLKLGLISFGGPIAHLSYFHKEFVMRRRWIEDEAVGDLMALCQFLPGPASSQLVFALGMQRAGILGALTASFCFTTPSAVIMIAFGYGVASAGDLRHAGWLHGLKLTAVAVVAQAVWGMGRKLCPDRGRLSLCLASAALLLALPGAYNQVAVIVIGALAGWLMYRDSPAARMVVTPSPARVRTHVIAACALILFFATLFITPVMAAATHDKRVALFDSFYRSGALVFGGGHVVLPLLRSETVPRGWISDDQFLAGYGAAQAVPGPLFTFAAYLGTVITGGRQAWSGGLLCLFAIFFPAWLLIGSVLPFWNVIRSKDWAQAALRGANAAVVGILLAALYTPVITGSVKQPADIAAVLIAFGLLEGWKAPPWLIVIAMAAAGQWLLPA